MFGIFSEIQGAAYRESPADKWKLAGSEIQKVNWASPEGPGWDFDFHPECDGKFQDAS